MDKLKTLRAFHTQITLLSADLAKCFPGEGYVTALNQFIGSIPIDDLIRDFIKYVVPWGPRIKARNEKFFLKNDKIFGSISKEKVSRFKDLWLSNSLHPEDRELIWNYFEILVKLARHYRKFIKVDEQSEDDETESDTDDESE